MSALERTFRSGRSAVARAFGRIETAGDELVFDARLEAEVVQACVATLKPVPAVVKTSFERRFRRGDEASSTQGRSEIVLEGDDADIDVLETDHIDIGEVIAEEFYLALDPYPRAEDADVVMAEVRGPLGQDDAAFPTIRLRSCVGIRSMWC